MNHPTNKYPGKILLFGEYTVLLGSNALAIPFTRYGGQWSDENQLLSLSEFYAYLSENENIDFLDSKKLDFLKFSNKKIFSDIPMGYGAGSSGCVVAAIYDFCKKEELTLQNTQRALGLMESFFHGNSSGIDPLVSLFQQAILRIDSSTEIVPITSSDGSYELFLLDTGISRETSILVTRFKKEIERESLIKGIHTELIPAVNNCISRYIDGDMSRLFMSFTKINQFQFDHFNWLVPIGFQYIFEKGIQSKSFSLKICGAGGGGYLLGIRKKGYLFESTIEQRIQDLP